MALDNPLVLLILCCCCRYDEDPVLGVDSWATYSLNRRINIPLVVTEDTKVKFTAAIESDRCAFCFEDDVTLLHLTISRQVRGK